MPDLNSGGEKVTLWQAVRYCIVQKYASGKGRAGRAELIAYALCFILFCLFWLLFIICQIEWEGGINLLDFVLLYIPFLFVPPLVGVCVRRMHDLGQSGWLALILLIPLLNIIGLGLLFARGMPYANRYGPPPARVVL